MFVFFFQKEDKNMSTEITFLTTSNSTQQFLPGTRPVSIFGLFLLHSQNLHLKKFSHGMSFFFKACFNEAFTRGLLSNAGSSPQLISKMQQGRGELRLYFKMLCKQVKLPGGTFGPTSQPRAGFVTFVYTMTLLLGQQEEETLLVALFSGAMTEKHWRE